MATKVGGTDLINDSGNLVNFTDLDAKYDGMYPDVQTVGSGQSSIDLSYAVVKVTVTSNNYPYTFANVGLGNVCTIIVDTTANGYVPVFPERESGQLYWPVAGRPNWSSHRYWVITVIGVGRLSSSGVDVRATYFGHDDPASAANPISAGTLLCEANPDEGFFAYASDVVSDGSGASAYATAGLSFRSISGAFDAIGYEGSGNDYARRYNPGGGYTTVGGSSTITLYTGPNGITPTGWRLVYGPTSNPTQFDTGWKTSGVATCEAYASASAGSGNSQTDNDYVVAALWGRASGYDDTVLATIRLHARAYAESSCFIGSARIALKNQDSIRLSTMEDAYHGWQAQQSANEISDVEYNEIAIGNENAENKILEFRKKVGRYRLYGFNTEEPFVTGGHPFLTTDGWKCFNEEAGQTIRPDLNPTQINVGDRLIKYNFITNSYFEEEITSIIETFESCAVYSIDVEGPDSESATGNDTYIVNGYVVHNK